MKSEGNFQCGKLTVSTLCAFHRRQRIRREEKKKLGDLNRLLFSIDTSAAVPPARVRFEASNKFFGRDHGMS